MGAARPGAASRPLAPCALPPLRARTTVRLGTNALPESWRRLYDTGRKRLNGTWLQENANVGLQYRDWLSSGDADSAASIARGAGAVVRHGLHRLALYRSADDVLHAFSARCPHLGCSVRWNAVEKSWDCPCHGSRFAAEDGHVLNGPALQGLDRADASIAEPEREASGG